VSGRTGKSEIPHGEEITTGSHYPAPIQSFCGLSCYSKNVKNFGLSRQSHLRFSVCPPALLVLLESCLVSFIVTLLLHKALESCLFFSTERRLYHRWYATKSRNLMHLSDFWVWKMLPVQRSCNSEAIIWYSLDISDLALSPNQTRFFEETGTIWESTSHLD